MRDGSWQRLHDALRDQVRVRENRKPLPTATAIDLHPVRGADTAPTGSRGYDGARGPTGAKRHVAVDTGGLPRTVLATMAGLQEKEVAIRLLTPPAPRVRHDHSGPGRQGIPGAS
ncbi:transposase [Streptomyces sp. NPDC006733]|uniref:transposase n=1 Tax=Streptomyces sp. NPDC006733 TaxID=3155460 RepID=UPI0033F06D91